MGFTYPVGFMSPKVGGDPLRDGLISEWLFESGSLLDTSDNSNNGTGVNNPSTITGIDGVANSAYRFNAGFSQELTFGNMSGINGLSEFTMCAWIRKSAGERIQLGRSSNSVSPTNFISLNWNTDNNLYVFSTNNTNGFKILSRTTDYDVWNFVILEFNGALTGAARLSIFWNNVDVTSLASVSGSTWPTVTNSETQTFRIGRYYTGVYSSKDIDNVRTYSKILSSDVKTALYAEKTV